MNTIVSRYPGGAEFEVELNQFLYDEELAWGWFICNSHLKIATAKKAGGLLYGHRVCRKKKIILGFGVNQVLSLVN